MAVEVPYGMDWRLGTRSQIKGQQYPVCLRRVEKDRDASLVHPEIGERAEG